MVTNKGMGEDLGAVLENNRLASPQVAGVGVSQTKPRKLDPEILAKRWDIGIQKAMKTTRKQKMPLQLEDIGCVFKRSRRELLKFSEVRILVKLLTISEANMWDFLLVKVVKILFDT